MTTTCQNCEFSFEGKFCPNCSQKADTHRLTLGHLGHEVVHAVTHTDKGIFFLIKEMLRRPGVVGKEYVAGKRKKYFNPVTYLLIMLAIQIYAVKKTDFYGKFTNTIEQLVTSAARAQGKEPDIKELGKGMDEARRQASMATENSKVLTFLYIPVLALMTWLLFYKSGYNFSENLVFHIFISAQGTVFFIPICIIPILINPGLVVLVLYLFLLVSILYALFAYRQFYGEGRFATIGKGLVAQIVYFFVITFSSQLIAKWML